MIRTGGYKKRLFTSLSPSNNMASWEPGSGTATYTAKVLETIYVLYGELIAVINGVETYHHSGSEIIIDPDIPRRFGVNTRSLESTLTLNVYEGIFEPSIVQWDGRFSTRYRKTLMNALSPSNSMIEWPSGARTPAHDHSCRETTYVLRGTIYSIVDGVKTYHEAGSIIPVPVGVVHEVGSDSDTPTALSLNICDGHLSMNLYPSSTIE